MTIKVLIVEDDPSIAQMQQKLLQQLKFDVKHVMDGAAGVQAFVSFSPDVCLIDGLLPKKVGVDVAREIRGLPGGKDVGLILVSAVFKSGPARREAYAAGFDTIFNKPYVLVDLVGGILELAKKYSGKDNAAARLIGKRTIAKRPHGKVNVVKTGVFNIIQKSTEAPEQKPKKKSMKQSAAKKPKSVEKKTQAKVVITEAGDGAACLVRLARRGVSGVLTFKAQNSNLSIAYRHGVIIGAGDNAKENRLRSLLLRRNKIDPARLIEVETRMRDRRERFLEAAVAVGAIDTAVAFDELHHQLTHRVSLAALWPKADAVVFAADAAAAEEMYVSPVDLPRILLRALLAFRSHSVVGRFVEQFSDHQIITTPDLERYLAIYAEGGPEPRLPGLLFQPGTTVRGVCERLGDGVGHDLWALHRCGAWFHESRAFASIPKSQAVPAAISRGTTLDREIQVALLSARGKNHYEIIGVRADASRETVLSALDGLETKLGRNAPGADRIRLSKAAARELWEMFADIRLTLTDESVREAYDEELGLGEPLIEGTLISETHTQEELRDLELQFLQGMLAYQQQDYEKAKPFFDLVTAARSDDIDANAFAAMTSYRLALSSFDDTVACLARIHSQAPTSIRTLILWFDAAESANRLDEARRVLRIAESLDPQNWDVNQRRSRVGRG